MMLCTEQSDRQRLMMQHDERKPQAGTARSLNRLSFLTVRDKYSLFAVTRTVRNEVPSLQVKNKRILPCVQ